MPRQCVGSASSQARGVDAIPYPAGWTFVGGDRDREGTFRIVNFFSRSLVVAFAG